MLRCVFFMIIIIIAEFLFWIKSRCRQLRFNIILIAYIDTSNTMLTFFELPTSAFKWHKIGKQYSYINLH